MSENAPGKIHAAMIAMLTEVEAIGKNRRNQQQGFNFRGIDDAYSAVHPLLAKHGVYPTSKILDHTREERRTQNDKTLLYSVIRMEYTFWAADGSSVTTEVIGEAMDTGDKASNKAMSVAYKYALFQILCIPVVTLDPDATTQPPSDLARPRSQPPPKQPPARGSAEPSGEVLALQNIIGSAHSDETAGVAWESIKSAVKANSITAAQKKTLVAQFRDHYREILAGDILAATSPDAVGAVNPRIGDGVTKGWLDKRRQAELDTKIQERLRQLAATE